MTPLPIDAALRQVLLPPNDWVDDAKLDTQIADIKYVFTKHYILIDRTSQPYSVMTGAEWLARFETEFSKLDNKAVTRKMVYETVRKAAGVVEQEVQG